MRAWRAHELGAPEDVLRLEEIDDPTPGAGQVLVRVHACDLNFPDVLLLAGQYQENPPLPLTPGLENAPAALRSLADRGTVGKVVVCP